MPTLEVSVDDREVKQLLAELTRHMTDMTPAMREIGEIVTESIQRNFEEHRSPDGTAWLPVSDEYAAWKRKKGKSPENILSFKGDLLHSIHPEAEATRVTVGTGPHIVYAAVHQFGSRILGGRRGGGIVARPYVGVRDDDWPEIHDALQHYLMEAKG